MGINSDISRSADTSELRHQAGKRLRENNFSARLSGTEEDSRLFHELQVHQIELEMQNAELRQARNEMETALGKYTDLYDFAPVGYFTLDCDGAVREANLTGASLLGIERSGLIGRQFEQFITNDAQPSFKDFLQNVLESRVKNVCQSQIIKEGSYPTIVQIEAMSAAEGAECRLALIDISGRKRVEEELETANIELEAFNYTVSHDLRRPLTVINSYCQVIQEQCFNRPEEPCKEYVREIFESTLQMNRLIDTLLNFSRISHAELQPEKIDLCSIAETTAMELRIAEPSRSVAFRIAKGLIANGDAGLLKVVLDNLIGNAWKYTSMLEESQIEFGVTEVDGKPVWFVRDNGPGFAVTDAEKIFIPFHRLTGSEEFRGHGIGLATVERIIRRHGGRVWAEGAPGMGACFYFTLSNA